MVFSATLTKNLFSGRFKSQLADNNELYRETGFKLLEALQQVTPDVINSTLTNLQYLNIKKN